MAQAEVINLTIDTTEGEGPYTVSVVGYAKAAVQAVPQSSTISTAVIEIKEGWLANEPTGISFSPAVTLDASGAAPSIGIDVTNSPFLLFDVTTFEAGKTVDVIVYLTDAVSPV